MAQSLPSSSPAYPAPKDAAPEERSAILDEYCTLAGAVRSGITGLTREQLLAFPVPGTWSIHQIVLHLADAEAAFADRFRRIIADASPKLISFDENRSMTHLGLPQRDAQLAARLLELTRLDLSLTFATLPTETLLRTGHHDELGPISLLAHLKRANWHLNHHLKFLHEKRNLVLKSHS